MLEKMIAISSANYKTFCTFSAASLIYVVLISIEAPAAVVFSGLTLTAFGFWQRQLVLPTLFLHSSLLNAIAGIEISTATMLMVSAAVLPLLTAGVLKCSRNTSVTRRFAVYLFLCTMLSVILFFSTIFFHGAIHPIVFLIMVIIFLPYASLQTCRRSDDKIVVLSYLALSPFCLVIYLMMSTGITPGERLTLGTARSLANAFGVGALISFLLFWGCATGIGSFILSPRIRIAFFSLFLVYTSFLLITGSRGVFVALLFSVFYIVYSTILSSRLSISRAYSLSLLTMLIIILLILAGFLLQPRLTGLADFFVVFDRFLIGASDDGRLYVWRSGFENFDPRFYLFGAGALSFSEIARVQLGWRDEFTYAHSVFIDIFFSVGLVGLLFVIALVFLIPYAHSPRRARSSANYLTIFMIISYSLHGYFWELSFWICASLLAILLSATIVAPVNYKKTLDR